jgi:SSS family solute:Na+ symporter
MKLSSLDWAIMGLYGLVMVVLGIFFSRRASRSTGDFFLAGRNLPWWIAGTSMVATTFAADTPLLVTAFVRTGGVGANWIWFNFAISHLITTFFLADLWRRARIVTDVELCERRYAGPGARALRFFKGAFFSFVTNSVVMGWVILAMATISEEIFGLPKLVSIGACVLIAFFYTSLSGLYGVVATDFVQFSAAMAGSILLTIAAYDHVGGISGFAEVLPGLLAENGRPAMEMLPPVFSGGKFVGGAFMGFLTAVCVQWWSWKYSDGGGILIQRMSSARDERHSMLSMLWFTFANYVVRPWPWFIVALISLAVFPEVTDHKAVYPKMMAAFMGPGLLGLMMAAMLAAFMSTIDTHINIASAYFVNDLYRRFLAPGRSERHYLWVARGSGLLFVLIASLIALYNESIRGLFELLLELIAGAGAVFLLRWFWWRLNAWSELSAMVASLLIAGGLRLSNLHGWIPHSFDSWEIMLINVFLSGAIWLAVTFATPPTEAGALETFYRSVRPPGAWAPVRRGMDSPPSAPSGSGRSLENVLLGLVLVYGVLFGLGWVLYGKTLQGLLLCLAGAGALARILHNVTRRFRMRAA